MSKSAKIKASDRKQIFKNRVDWLNTPATTCFRKVTYVSERAGERAAQEQMDSNVSQGKTLRVYKCLECKKFHLTSTVKFNPKA